MHINSVSHSLSEQSTLKCRKKNKNILFCLTGNIWFIVYNWMNVEAMAPPYRLFRLIIRKAKWSIETYPSPFVISEKSNYPNPLFITTHFFYLIYPPVFTRTFLPPLGLSMCWKALHSWIKFYKQLIWGFKMLSPWCLSITVTLISLQNCQLAHTRQSWSRA